MHRHEIADDQGERVGSLLPKREARTGRPPSDPRRMLNGMFWVLATGASWRDLPERYGPWQTVYDHFRGWRKAGVFTALLQALHLELDDRGQLDFELWCVDGSNVRASRAAAGADKKVSGGTPTSRPTTRWAAAGAASAPSSTWSLTARALPWRRN